MKIGMITFHRATNCGAALQTYGLFYYLKSLGYQIEIIDYIPNNMITPRRNFIYNVLHAIRTVVTPIPSIRNKKRNKLFDLFLNKHMSLSKGKYLGDKEIETSELKYDILISGSDQILNTTLTGNSRAYYLHFASGKKISYASSFGRTNISQTEVQLIKNELKRFDYISVRELSSVGVLKNIIDITPEVVCDPVFLLDKNQWQDIFNKERIINHKYIFLYLMEENDNTLSVIDSVQKKYKLPIVTVIGGMVHRIYPNRNYCCGPEEFLNYINNAELIITNSFHATAFSIILKKKYITIAHSSRNARLESLFQIIHAENKLITKAINADKVENYILDGSVAYGDLDVLIQESKEYLKKALS
jgi:hypothetical protein